MIAPGPVARFGAVVLTQGRRPEDLRAAVESLLAQRDVEVDLVVVGNGWEPRGLPDGVKTLGLPENLGIPAGRNAGVPHVEGELLMFLDDDALLPDPGFLAEAARRFAADPRLGVIQPRVDVRGGGEAPRRWTPRSRVGDRTRSGAAFSLWEGAVVIPREVFVAAGGWPDAFWYALEGHELAWRVWDTGRTALYAGDMVAEHPLTPFTRHAQYYRLYARNRVWLARRNLPVVFGVPYALSWALLQVVRSWDDPAALRSHAGGLWEGLTSPTERKPLRWRTIATMTRHGRPPVW